MILLIDALCKVTTEGLLPHSDLTDDGILF